MTYNVIHDFKDLQYNDHNYSVGDTYPVKGSPEPPEERIQELLSSNNKLGRAVIEESKKSSKKETKKRMKTPIIPTDNEENKVDLQEVNNEETKVNTKEETKVNAKEETKVNTQEENNRRGE